METLPVIINGDDIAFMANAPFYEIWKTKVAELGFELSVGKNYCHPEFLTINSSLYYLGNPDLYDEEWGDLGDP